MNSIHVNIIIHCVSISQAMGKYTRVITDFSVLPDGVNEGKAGDFWYHEDTKAYFDDADHYRMIRTMCQLSCNVCDNAEDQVAQAKRKSKFRSIDQLKGHLYCVHRLHMCNLCLEGRKVKYLMNLHIYTLVDFMDYAVKFSIKL